MNRILQLARLVTVEAGLLAETIWRWWRREILQLLPQKFAGRGALVAEFSGTGFVFAQEGRTGRSLAPDQPAGGIVSLRLGGQAVLRRTLKLPVSARFKLRDILTNDLDRQSPLDPAAVLFTYRILSVERAAAKLVVSLVLVRRDVVESAIAALHDLGLRVNEVCAHDPASGREDRLDPPQKPPRKFARRHRVAAALLALTFALLAADVVVRAAHQQAVISQLRNQEMLLRAAASRVEDIQAQVDEARDRAGFFAAQKSQPSLGVILAEITRLLPDGTWLSTLSFDGQTIEMQGYSNNASNLIPAFDGSKLFSNAGFRAPMTQGPQPNLQQFDLSMSLAGP